MSSSPPGGHRSAVPMSFHDRRTSHPPPPVMLVLNLTVATLPAAHRDRYALEFLAELHDVGRTAQLRHALGLAANGLSLRLALRNATPVTQEGPTMRRSLRCRLRLHHDVKRYNGEAQPPTQYLQCTRCGRVRDTARRPPGVLY